MTGLHDERATKEPRRSKRLARSRPEAEAAAAPPPARRTRRAEASGPAARAAPSPSPPYGEWDSEDVTAAYVLRNRDVIVPDTNYRKPTPRHYGKGKEPKHDRSWQTQTCALVALEHYNSMNQGDEHELVKAVNSNVFVFNGIWRHANFLAKRKGATSCVDLVPKYFFAELKMERSDLSCVSCAKLDPGDPKNIGGCGVCPRQIMHPAAGGYHGAQPRPIQHAATGLQISSSF